MGRQARRGSTWEAGNLVSRQGAATPSWAHLNKVFWASLLTPISEYGSSHVGEDGVMV